MSNRRWFHIHLSTAFMMLLTASILLGLNIFVVTLPATVFEDGLPIVAYSRGTVSQFALRIPGTLYFNIALNLGFCAMIAIIFENRIRRKKK